MDGPTIGLERGLPLQRYLRRLAGFGIRVAPFPLRLRLCAALNGYVLRRFETAGMGIADVMPIEEVLVDQPDAVAAAVRSAGGPASVERMLRHIYDHAYPLTYAIFARADVQRGGRLTVSGPSVVADAAASGPVVILMPHLGIREAAWAHLVRSGHRLTGMSYRPERQQFLFDVLSDMGANDLADRPTVIPIESPMAVFAARRALQEGRMLVWQPDIYPDSRRGTGNVVVVDYMGSQRQVSGALGSLLKESSATLVLATALLRPPHAIEVAYRPVKLELHATPEQAAYAAMEDAILADIDQWRLLWTPQLVTGSPTERRQS